MDQPSEKYKGIDNDTEPASEKNKSSDDESITSISAGKTPPDAEDSQYKQTRNERYFYLATQAALVVITAVGIAIALYSLSDLNQSVVAANKQASAAATQAVTAQQEFELSQRPWVSIDITQIGDLTFNANGSQFPFAAIVKNTGHSPAAHVQVDVQMIPIRMDKIFAEPLSNQKKLCEAARNPTKKTVELNAFTLFPGDQTTKEYGLSMTPDAIEEGKFTDPLDSKKRAFLTPVIVGCVDYQFEFATSHHQTGFIYMVYRIEPDHPFSPSVIYPGQNLDSSRLKLVPYGFGGSYAD